MPRPAPTARRDLVLVAAITAFAAILRFATLDVQSFWFDEAVTVDLLDGGLGDMLDKLPDSESTPPLYYVLAWLWTRVAGLGEVGVRSFSALCGTAAVPLVWAAGRELCGRRAGLAAAAIAAVSPILVWYSQEARSYALLFLFAALSLWLLARIRREPSTSALVLWGLACALALATHYFALFLVAVEGVYLLARLGRRALPALAMPVVAGAALLPLAIAQKSADYAGYIAGDSLLKRTAQVGKQFAVGFDAPLAALTTTVVLAVAAAGVWLALTRTEDEARAGARLAAGIALGALLLPFAAALVGQDYVLTRNLLPAWAPLAVVVGAGLGSAAAGRAGRLALGVALVAMLAATIGVPLHDARQRDDWRTAAAAIHGPAPRAIVANQPNPATAVELYRPSARPAGAVVEAREVFVILGRGDDGPVPGVPGAPAARLRVAGRKLDTSFVLYRLVPARGGSARIDRALLQGLHAPPGENPPAVLVEPR
jgi:hypothetical protein